MLYHASCERATLMPTAMAATMIIVDAHQNIAFNAQQLGRDYRRWAWHSRRDEAGRNVPPAFTSLPDNLHGGVAIVFGSIKVVPETWSARPAWQSITYRTDEDARQLARWQLDSYRRLADENDSIQLILSRSDLDQVLETWNCSSSIAGRKQGHRGNAGRRRAYHRAQAM